jgi:putative transposase
MKKSKYTVEQIIGILREAQGGNGVAEVARRYNVSANTIYKWRRTYGEMEVAEARRLKQLEEENARLKRVVADLAVKVQILQEVNAKKW